jgi:hypothetical protein
MELHALSEVETISRKHLNPLLTRRSHVTMCGERVNAITDMPVSRALEGRTQYLPAYETLLWIELHFTCHLVQIHDLPVVGRVVCRVVVTVCLLGGQHLDSHLENSDDECTHVCGSFDRLLLLYINLFRFSIYIR